MLIELDVDRKTASHVALAVRHHREALARAGKPCPESLAAVEVKLTEAVHAAAIRQFPPLAATVAGAVQDDRDDPSDVHDREWLSVREVALVTGLGVRTLERRLADGTLPSTRIGRCRRIARGDLNGFMEGRT